MNFCEILLAAGLAQAAACGEAGAAPSLLEAENQEALKPVAAGEAWRLQESSELLETPRGRRTGYTLYDVARDVAWRQAAFDRMQTGE